MNSTLIPDLPHSEEACFSAMAASLANKGYCVMPNALALDMAAELADSAHNLSDEEYFRAGIGRAEQHLKNSFVRRDEVCWIDGSSDAGQRWLEWSERLRIYLNRHLFLGLFTFESHFAHYPPGAFYKTHLDAFKGQSNRILSLVTYLNHQWQPDDGGEMVLYMDEDSLKVTPALGTVVIFLSEEFPHEVLATQRDRYSIAGWFRLNTSISGQIDPPQ